MKKSLILYTCFAFLLIGCKDSGGGGTPGNNGGDTGNTSSLSVTTDSPLTNLQVVYHDGTTVNEVLTNINLSINSTKACSYNGTVSVNLTCNQTEQIKNTDIDSGTLSFTDGSNTVSMQTANFKLEQTERITLQADPNLIYITEFNGDLYMVAPSTVSNNLTNDGTSRVIRYNTSTKEYDKIVNTDTHTSSQIIGVFNNKLYTIGTSISTGKKEIVSFSGSSWLTEQYGADSYSLLGENNGDWYFKVTTSGDSDIYRMTTSNFTKVNIGTMVDPELLANTSMGLFLKVKTSSGASTYNYLVVKDGSYTQVNGLTGDTFSDVDSSETAVALDGNLYFVGEDVSSRWKVFKTDLSSVERLNTAHLVDEEPKKLTVFGDVLIFQAKYGSTLNALYKYTGSGNPTLLLPKESGANRVIVDKEVMGDYLYILSNGATESIKDYYGNWTTYSPRMLYRMKKGDNQLTQYLTESPYDKLYQYTDIRVINSTKTLILAEGLTGSHRTIALNTETKKVTTFSNTYEMSQGTMWIEHKGMLIYSQNYYLKVFDGKNVKFLADINDSTFKLKHPYAYSHGVNNYMLIMKGTHEKLFRLCDKADTGC